MEMFLNFIPDEEIKDGMILEQVRIKMENYFGVSMTNNGVSKIKKCSQYNLSSSSESES